MIGDEAQMDTRVSLLIRLRQEPTDQRAWDEFTDRYGRLIWAWCQQFGLQAADADDVSQNVLLKLAQHLRSFVYDPGRRFRGFLRTVAHNACKDYLASTRRAVAAGADSGIHAVLDSVLARDDLAARLEEAFDLERLEMAQARVRQRVEPHTWEAFRLTALEGHSGAEVAAALHMQVGTVFKAKSKVQRMLREEIERLEGEEPVWLTARAAPNSKTS
jgi:RNA polymerase sigma-70 factor (ECF subfamily)